MAQHFAKCIANFSGTEGPQKDITQTELPHVFSHSVAYYHLSQLCQHATRDDVWHMCLQWRTPMP